MYISIIDRRYELKEENDVEQVEQLENNFEAIKDTFLLNLREDLTRNRSAFQHLMQEQNRRLQSIR